MKRYRHSLSCTFTHSLFSPGQLRAWSWCVSCLYVLIFLLSVDSHNWFLWLFSVWKLYIPLIILHGSFHLLNNCGWMNGFAIGFFYPRYFWDLSVLCVIHFNCSQCHQRLRQVSRYYVVESTMTGIYIGNLGLWWALNSAWESGKEIPPELTVAGIQGLEEEKEGNLTGKEAYTKTHESIQRGYLGWRVVGSRQSQLTKGLVFCAEGLGLSLRLWEML